MQRTGHVDVFEDGEGRWWAVLLGVRPMKDDQGKWLEPQLGRETFLVGVEWIDDWPVFNGGKNVGILTQGPADVVQVARAKMWKANLEREDLEPGWYEKSEWSSGSRSILFTYKNRYTIEEMLVSI
mgnify:FL=1